jgi:uncharacterized protein (DUF305 family)
MNEKNTIVAVLVSVAVFAGGYFAGNSAERRDAVGTDYPVMMMDHSMGGAMDSMSMSLEGKTGDEFDRAFLDGMVVHHEGAVVMARQVLATSKRPELIKLAHDIIDAQTKEIGMMRGWRQAWFK